MASRRVSSSGPSSVVGGLSINQLLVFLSWLHACQGPFAPRALPRFHATMGLSDSSKGSRDGYWFPFGFAPALTHRGRPGGLPGSWVSLVLTRRPLNPGESRHCG